MSRAYEASGQRTAGWRGVSRGVVQDRAVCGKSLLVPIHHGMVSREDDEARSSMNVAVVRLVSDHLVRPLARCATLAQTIVCS